MGRTPLIVGSAVLAAAILGIGLTRRLTTAEQPAAGVSAELTSGSGVTLEFSDKPVDLPALQLSDLEGNAISKESLRGKVVLMNFWATWCAPCREEIPMLVALQQHYRDQLVVIGLSIDERPPAEVRRFAEQFAVNYPIVMADEQLQQAFGGISSVPSTFVVTPDGRIVQRHLGMLEARRTEHEVRALSGLRTGATIQTVEDTGQVLLSNAAYATRIPGVDLDGLTPSQKEAVLKRLNTEHCTCGCNLTLAACRINDPSCEVSLPIAKKIAADIRSGQ
jgi:thiol-disulfide isomerase/thioredoxin